MAQVSVFHLRVARREDVSAFLALKAKRKVNMPMTRSRFYSSRDVVMPAPKSGIKRPVKWCYASIYRKVKA